MTNSILEFEMNETSTGVEVIRPGIADPADGLPVGEIFMTQQGQPQFAVEEGAVFSIAELADIANQMHQVAKAARRVTCH